MNIGQRIKAARKEINITQEELGIACGWGDGSPQSRVAGYERNTRQLTPEQLATIAKALRKPITYFFQDESISSLVNEESASYLAATITGTTSDIETLKNIITRIERIASEQHTIMTPEQKARAICALLQTELIENKRSEDSTVSATIRAITI